jgi:hypothetical protein
LTGFAFLSQNPRLSLPSLATCFSTQSLPFISLLAKNTPQHRTTPLKKMNYSRRVFDSEEKKKKKKVEQLRFKNIATFARLMSGFFGWKTHAKPIPNVTLQTKTKRDHNGTTGD